MQGKLVYGARSSPGSAGTQAQIFTATGYRTYY
jgi:hypothetical protein